MLWFKYISSKQWREQPGFGDGRCKGIVELPMFKQEAPSTLCPAKLVEFQKRRGERSRCKAGLIARVMLSGAAKSLEAWIRDISEFGFGLIMAVELPVGQEITVKLKKNSAVHSIEFEARAVHCTQESEHCWHVGCEFKQPLTPELVEYLSR